MLCTKEWNAKVSFSSSLSSFLNSNSNVLVNGNFDDYEVKMLFESRKFSLFNISTVSHPHSAVLIVWVSKHASVSFSLSLIICYIHKFKRWCFNSLSNAVLIGWVSKHAITKSYIQKVMYWSTDNNNDVEMLFESRKLLHLNIFTPSHVLLNCLGVKTFFNRKQINRAKE